MVEAQQLLERMASLWLLPQDKEDMNMKNKILLAVLPLIALTSCTAKDVAEAYLSMERGLPTIHVKDSEHVTYLLLSPFGSIESYTTADISTKGVVSELFYENTVVLKADAGTKLPDKTQVKTTVTNAEFRGWAYYDESNDHVWPDYYETVPEVNGLALKAIFDGPTGGSGGGGSGGGGGSTVTSKTWTITALPEWVTEDGCVIFAWAWQNGADGKWYSLEFASATSASFEAPGDIVGMLFVRCAAGTTTPNWNMSTDGPGRIYNQTSDIAVSSGVTSYTCSDWTEYNPSN